MVPLTWCLGVTCGLRSAGSSVVPSTRVAPSLLLTVAQPLPPRGASLTRDPSASLQHGCCSATPTHGGLVFGGLCRGRAPGSSVWAAAGSRVRQAGARLLHLQPAACPSLGAGWPEGPSFLHAVSQRHIRHPWCQDGDVCHLTAQECNR